MTPDIEVPEAQPEAPVEELPPAPEILAWVGEKPVIGISVAEPADLVGVLYLDETDEDFTLRQWESVKSEYPYNDGEVTLRKYSAVIKEIIQLLMAERCDINSFHFPLQRVEFTIGENYRHSIAKLYGVDDVNHIHLSDIHAILTSENTSA